jgi:hypothetical protein
MRIVIAEDSVLLRAGSRPPPGRRREEVVATVGDADTLSRPSSARARPRRGRRAHAAHPHRRRAARRARRSGQRWPEIGILVLSQYVEERYATELLADGTAGSATCSRTASPTCRVPGRGACESATVAPCSTPRWWPSSSPGPASATRSTPCRPASERCWPSGRGPHEHSPVMASRGPHLPPTPPSACAGELVTGAAGERRLLCAAPSRSTSATSSSRSSTCPRRRTDDHRRRDRRPRGAASWLEPLGARSTRESPEPPTSGPDRSRFDPMRVLLGRSISRAPSATPPSGTPADRGGDSPTHETPGGSIDRDL